MEVPGTTVFRNKWLYSLIFNHLTKPSEVGFIVVCSDDIDLVTSFGNGQSSLSYTSWFRFLKAFYPFKSTLKLVYVFYHKSSEIRMEPEVFRSLFEHLPLFIQEKVLKYRKWQDRQRSVIGKNLLLIALGFFDPAPSCSLDHLRYTAFQRPYLDDTFDFNISHANDFTICAISKTNRVGIDIEKTQSIDLDDFENQFSRTELNQLSQVKNQHHAFFDLWTQKEAFVKAFGEGLNISLNKITIENRKLRYDDQDWFLHEISLHPEYHCHLCTSASSPQIITREVQF